MSLAPGTRLGPYEITGQIGAGGMGEVYRATDTNLKRTVAIKVLPEAVATDGERLARFQREAEVLARLNHPNIAAIYGLEKSDGTAALVMELVEGPTLADRIAQGPIPLDEALPIAKQIAEALEAAHEQGIIHRDLKPANVKVRPDGMVKVLDFGLAKALEPVSAGSTDATTSPTITSPAMMTRIGVILGTAAYMSPEQAKGRAADKRSDVWAFGCVLFEMVTGRRAFEGEDISDTLAAVLRGEPEWTALPANVSPALVALLRGCLDKDRRRRVADLSTARFIIDREGEAVTAVAVSPASQIRRAASILVAVAAAAGIAAYTTFSLTRVSAPSLPVVRSTIALPMGDRFSNPGVHCGGALCRRHPSRVRGEPTTLSAATGPARTDAHPRHRSRPQPGRASTESVLFTRWSVDRLLAGRPAQEGLDHRRRAARAVCCGEPVGRQLDERQHDSLRAKRRAPGQAPRGSGAYRAKVESPSTS